ncbi:MAG: VCBS repeat-containing protein, partial [Planctomycetes bacterium]|nr:VCBS repeat-containing protein [Planctomycetota bacterium]
DIDGDGIPDFLVGAHLSDTGGNNSGSVHAFSGGTGSLLFVAHGDGAEDMLGTAVAILDDLDGDGHAEFLAGAPGVDAHAGFFNTGRVRVYSGTDGTVLHDIPGPMSTNAQFGVSLAALDDVDGDGIGDFAVGAQGEVVTFGGGVGTVRIYSGSSGALIRTNAIDSNSVDSFGFAVSRAGDVDGDGIGDYVIGSPIDPFPGMTSVGRAWIYSGATGLVMVTLSGNASQSHFGDAVGAAGDIDGDGYAEVLIGSRLASVQGSFSGRAVVFSSTAATKYGLGFGGQQSLDLGWQPGAMPPAGQVVAGGAGAFAPGVISIATQSGFLAVGSPPIPLWIDLASIIVQEFFSFDASGNWAVASTLDLPGLAGASLFCQVADISGYPTVSNGLRFTFN